MEFIGFGIFMGLFFCGAFIGGNIGTAIYQGIKYYTDAKYPKPKEEETE